MRYDKQQKSEQKRAEARAVEQLNAALRAKVKAAEQLNAALRSDLEMEYRMNIYGSNFYGLKYLMPLIETLAYISTECAWPKQKNPQ